MHIPEWVLHRFSSTETKDSSKLEQELIDVTRNEKLKFKKGYSAFWLKNQIPIFYPELWSVVQQFFKHFQHPTWLDVEFSAITNQLTQ